MAADFVVSVQPPPHACEASSAGLFSPEELARSFNVSPQIISEMSQYNLLTVYHDRIGRIIDLKISQQDEEEE